VWKNVPAEKISGLLRFYFAIIHGLLPVACDGVYQQGLLTSTVGCPLVPRSPIKKGTLTQMPNTHQIE